MVSLAGPTDNARLCAPSIREYRSSLYILVRNFCGSITSNRKNKLHMIPGDEQQLLARAKQCDTDALGELYDRYSAKIYAYVLYHVTTELAEDLTAGVFIKMLDAVRSSKAGKLVLGWLYRIAHNMIVDHFRRNGQRQYLPLDEHLVAARRSCLNRGRNVDGEMLSEALLYLTEEQRLVIVYKFCEGFSNLQVAKLMGKTEGAIKSLQYRALASLRRYLEGHAGKGMDKRLENAQTSVSPVRRGRPDMSAALSEVEGRAEPLLRVAVALRHRAEAPLPYRGTGPRPRPPDDRSAGQTSRPPATRPLRWWTQLPHTTFARAAATVVLTVVLLGVC